MVLVWSVGLCRFDHDVKGEKKGKKRKRKKEAIGEKEGAANSFVPPVSLRILPRWPGGGVPRLVRKL